MISDTSMPEIRSKDAAVASLKCGNRQDAQRHVRHLKLATDSRSKCISLLNRVEEVLGVIADAEATKKVSLTFIWAFILCSL